MKKRQKLYWIPCAAHCIDLMLEDFEKKNQIYIYSRTGLMSLHKYTKGIDLIRQAYTYFAISYLTLGCLNENKGSLIRMFASKD